MYIKTQISFVLLLLLSARCISVSTTVTGEDVTCKAGETPAAYGFASGDASQCSGLSKITTEAECELANLLVVLLLRVPTCPLWDLN